MGPWRARGLASVTIAAVALALPPMPRSPSWSPPPARAADTVIRDCPDCPELVVLPAGHFVMGSSAEDRAWAASHGSNAASVADEAPQHAVTISSFAIGRSDVTRGQFAAFARETGYATPIGCGRDSYKWNLDSTLSWQHPGFDQGDRDPVVCVTWEDARAYVRWLNGKVHASGATPADGPYRLPSEAEWEYAARGGTSTRFWWGESDSAASSYAWFRDNAGNRTHPATSRHANPYGVFDIVGDVWQWTADCYAESYANAPGDGRPAQGAGDCMRVDRGGSWLCAAWFLRPTTRERNPPCFRDRIMGFRVAKTI